MTEAKRLAALLDELDGRFHFPGTCGVAAAELRRLEAECEALRAKAARYDWLTRREGEVSVLAFKNDYRNPFTTIRASGSLNVDGHFDCVHEAIDAAMGKEKA